MNNRNTSAARTQRNPLVEPKQFLSHPEGNLGAASRDLLRLMNPGLRCFSHETNCESFKFFVAPGEVFGKPDRRGIEGVMALIHRSEHPLEHTEIEFTASPRDLFKAASGLPEDYAASTIDWALSVCLSVIICVDTAPGKPEGEAYWRLSPIQASFHCAADQVDPWVDYLARRVRPTQHFAVVRFDTSEARS